MKVFAYLRLDILPTARSVIRLAWRENTLLGGVEITRTAGHTRVRVLTERQAERVADLARKGARAFGTSFCEKADFAGVVEVDDGALEGLRSLVREIGEAESRVAESSARAFDLASEMIRSTRTRPWIKLRVPYSDALTAALDQSLPRGTWFWSREHRDYVIHPDHAGELRKVLDKVFPGKNIVINRGNVWDVSEGR